MMRRISKTLALAFVPAVLALGFSLPSHAQSTPLAQFDVGVSPNPVGYDYGNEEVSAFVLGSTDGPTLDGTIDLYISTSTTACVYSQYNDLGSQSISSDSSYTYYYFYEYFTPNQTGLIPICSSYTNDTYYASQTTGPILLTVYGPASLSTYAAPQPVWGNPYSLYFVLSYNSGQPAPTGTITLYDDDGNQVGSPVTVGNITLPNGQTVTGAVIANPNFTDLTNPTYKYSAQFTSGDNNYSSESANGIIFFVNPLTSVTPAAVMAGPVLSSSDVSCSVDGNPGVQVTLNGLDFNDGTGAEISVDDINWQPLTLTQESTSTQLFACVPNSYLTTVASLYININVTGSNPVTLQVSPPYAVTTTASSSPLTFTYGENLTFTSPLTGTATRTLATDAAVPAGSANFTLNSTAQNGPSYSVGSGSLSQVSTPPLNPYQNPSLTTPLYEAQIDPYQTDKMISADLNGDGFVDVVGLPGTNPTTPAAGPYLQVFLSTGADGFQAEQQVYTGCAAQDFAVGDIHDYQGTGNGIPDLVVICPQTNFGALQGYYMLGNGDGTFQSPVAFTSNYPTWNPTFVVLGQFNYDGHNDIAVVDGNYGQMQVISLFGYPTYGPITYFNYPYDYVVGAGVADFNQDGLSDIALEEYSYPGDDSDTAGSGAILIYTSQGGGNGFGYDGNLATFSAGSYYLYQNMAITSLLGDNWPDVAIADSGGAYNSQDTFDNGSIQVFENTRNYSGDLSSTPTAIFQPQDSATANEGAVAGLPFPVVGSPASNAAAAPGWNLVFSYPAPSGEGTDTWVGELQFNSSTNTLTQVNALDTGTQAEGTEGGYVPGFIVAGDMNGDGFLDYAATGVVYNDGYQQFLVPYYYGNDAQISTSATPPQPLNSAPPTPPAGTYTLNMTYPGNQLFQANSAVTSPITVTVNQATPTITWATPAAITYGTALSATQLDATASVPGMFTYNPPANTVLTSGLQTLNVTFTPTDSVDYTTATASVTIQVNQATPTITWATPAAITYGTPLGSAQLDATATPPGGTFTYNPPAGTTLPVGIRTLTVTYTPPDTTDYTTASGSVTVQVNQATPVITWPMPAAITYPTALSATQLDATASTAGTFTYTPPAGTTLTAGPHTLNVSFVPTDTTDYTTASGSVTIQVNQAIPTITWATPAPITYGTALSATQLDATASVPGTFAYTPAAGTVLPIGSQTLTATFTPTDTTDYKAATATVTLIVNGQPISLLLTSSALSGTTTAGAMVTFQVQDPGTELPAGEIITFTGLPLATNPTAVINTNGIASFSYGAFPPGTYSIQANYPGDGVYASAQSPTLTLTVDPTPVTVNLTSSSGGNPIVYPATINLTANATSGGLGVPTGNIDFDDNGSLLPPSPVSLTIVNGTSGLLEGNTYANTEQTNIVTVTGDFNHDGNPDFATLQDDDGLITLVVALGNGDGTFGTPVVYNSTAGVDGTSDSMAAADLTGSGYSDDLVIGASDGNVTVFLSEGNSAGTLQLSQTIPSGYSSVVAVAAGQLSTTGARGFAVISNNSAEAFLDNGNGTFPNTPFWSTTSSNMYSDFTGIAVADYNQDGYSDFAVSDNASGAPVVSVYIYNSGLGTFNAPVSYPVGASATGIAAGNLNNDAYPDLAVLSNADNTVDVLINDHTGAFPSGTIYGVATSPTGIAIADFNGDGFGDIAVTGNGTGAGSGTSILLSSSTGAMTGEMLLPTTGGNSVATADFNLDGNPDLAVGSSGVTIFLDKGAQAIDSSVALAPGIHPLTAVYVPGDGSTFAGSTSSVLSQLVQAVPVVTWANPAAINYGTPLSTTQLNATASVPGTFAYDPALGTVLTAGTHQLAVIFTPTDTVTYESASATVNITVNQATPTVTWGAPAPIGYGTALSATQLDATASVPGAFTYIPALGTVLTVGAHQLTVNFVPTDSVDYKSASATVNITVSQATPTITWATPAAIAYGTALSATQLDATASVPGTFTYNPASGTVLTAGIHSLSVTFAPTDGTDYATTTATVTIQVNQTASTITWAAPSAITYGTALSATQLDATASVPGTFIYNPAAGTVLTAGAHTLGVTFAPTDSTDYQSSAASVSIQVNQAAPVITWAAPSAITYGTALSATQLDATASTAGTFTYTPAAGTTLTAGSHPLNVSFAPTDTTDYTAASGSVTIQVNQATPVITWPSPGNMSYGTALSSTQLDATATPSGGTFTYTPAAGTILPVGTQTLSVTYAPTDSTDYATATATTTVNVIAGFTLTSISPNSASYGSGITTVTLTGTGFTQSSIVELNGTAISSSYTSPTQLTAQIPASFFQQLSAGNITVFDPVKNVTTTSVTFTVTLPNLEITFSGPSTAAPGEQPTLNLIMSQSYPLAIQGTMTLIVDPLTPGGPTDPSVQFSTGGTTFNFTIPAGSTTTPTIQIQTGTLSATITVTLTLQANGVDIVPPSVVPVVVAVPNAAPVITSVTLTRSGSTLTVNIQGYSSADNVTLATFDFTPASGSSISNPEINVDVSSEFTAWYASDTSAQFGSSFSYSQVFNLSSNASAVGSVSVVLTNSVGQSNQVTAQ